MCPAAQSGPPADAIGSRSPRRSGPARKRGRGRTGTRARVPIALERVRRGEERDHGRDSSPQLPNRVPKEPLRLSLGRHCISFAQTALDHFRDPLAAPGFHPALQCSQLRLTVVNLWNHSDQSIDQGLGRYRGLRDQPPFDDWPCVGEWVCAGSPPVFGLRLLAMRRSHFAFRPG